MASRESDLGHKKRKRVPKSCVPCYESRRRCDREAPCGSCEKRSLPGGCVYSKTLDTPKPATTAPTANDQKYRELQQERDCLLRALRVICPTCVAPFLPSQWEPLARRRHPQQSLSFSDDQGGNWGATLGIADEASRTLSMGVSARDSLVPTLINNSDIQIDYNFNQSTSNQVQDAKTCNAISNLASDHTRAPVLSHVFAPSLFNPTEGTILDEGDDGLRQAQEAFLAYDSDLDCFFDQSTRNQVHV